VCASQPCGQFVPRRNDTTPAVQPRSLRGSHPHSNFGCACTLITLVVVWQCPRGTPSAIACAPGTFSNATDLMAAEECEICPIGFACPLGTSEPEQCKAGRWGGTPGQTSSDCSGACLGGHYCNAGSTSNTSGICRNARAGSNLCPAVDTVCDDSLRSSLFLDSPRSRGKVLPQHWWHK
jgi:hypothetical protein